MTLLHFLKIKIPSVYLKFYIKVIPLSFSLTDEEFNLFRDKIYEESGIHFSVINRPILESRIKGRLKLKEIDSPTDYFRVIQTEQSELNFLLDSVTTNLTNFFRNEAHFDSLVSLVYPEIIKRKAALNKRKLKVWSAGCSTGEEPYTIGITVAENVPNYESWKIDILASDISLKSLLVAKEGYYTDDKVENVNPIYLSKYFEKVNNGYKIKHDLKSIIRFDYHNLKNDNGERDIDIIFCRNVIIYFDRAAQIEVIKRFSECVNDDGYLFIGHSESLFGMDTDFKFHKLGNACVYRKK